MSDRDTSYREKVNSTSYTTALENRLYEQSERLEELHMEAAIDAQLTDILPIFDNYVNPNSVANCLSPYVPTTAAKIAKFVEFASLLESDVLLDIGCGDGRICVSAARLSGCRAVGIDVSPLCIAMARELAREENLEDRLSFFEADATIDPNRLLQSPLLESDLKDVTVIFLYTYPTLLGRLFPLLAKFTENGKARVVTLTYHLSQSMANIAKRDDEFDLCLYNRVFDVTSNE